MAEKREPLSPLRGVMTWEKWILAALLGLGGYDSHSKAEIADQLKAIQQSVHEVATSLAVVVSRLEEHERRLDRLEEPARGRR